MAPGGVRLLFCNVLFTFDPPGVFFSLLFPFPFFAFFLAPVRSDLGVCCPRYGPLRYVCLNQANPTPRIYPNW